VVARSIPRGRTKTPTEMKHGLKKNGFTKRLAKKDDNCYFQIVCFDFSFSVRYERFVRDVNDNVIERGRPIPREKILATEA
jgi:hypothetical protein